MNENNETIIKATIFYVQKTVVEFLAAPRNTNSTWHYLRKYITDLLLNKGNWGAREAIIVKSGGIIKT